MGLPANVISMDRFRNGLDFTAGRTFKGLESKQRKELNRLQLVNIAYAFFKEEMDEEGFEAIPYEFANELYKMGILRELNTWWDFPPHKILAAMLSDKNFMESIDYFIGEHMLPGDLFIRARRNLKAIAEGG